MAKKISLVIGANGLTQQLQSNDVLNTSIQQATVNFGAITQEDFNAVTTVLDSNILSTSNIICGVAGVPTTDHSLDEIVVSDISVVAGNIVPGVSFDIQAFCEKGTYGSYKINYTINY